MANVNSKINPTTGKEPEAVQQAARENAAASTKALAAGDYAEGQAAKAAVQKGSNA